MDAENALGGTAPGGDPTDVDRVASKKEGPPILLTAQVRLKSPHPSGIKTYVNLLAEGLRRSGQHVQVWGLGPDANPPDLKGLHEASRASRIPGVLQFWPMVVARLLKAKLPPGSIVHAQRPEELLPFIVLRPRARLVVTLHGPHWRSVRVKYGAFVEWVYFALSAVALIRADCVIAVSSNLADEVGRKLPSLRAKIRVIPPMVDERIFVPISTKEARDRLGISASAPVILYCGRLEKEKQVPLLLSAVRRVRDTIPTTELMICGTGSEEESIRAATQSLGIPTTFLGNRSMEEMPWVYASASVLVLTSEYEGLPTVALEALACGRPVVSNPFPGFDDLGDIAEGLELVSSKDDVTELEARIESVLSSSSPPIAPSKLLSSFSVTSVVDKILLAYLEISSRVASPDESSEVGQLTKRPSLGPASPVGESTVVFVTNYSPLAVGGVGQFMIDLGAQMINQGFSVSFLYRYEPPEFDLPPRVASARLIEVRGGPNPGLRTLPLLLRTAAKLLETRSNIGIIHLVVPQPMTALAAVVAKIKCVPVITTVFAPYPRKTRRTADFLHRTAEKIVFRLADSVVYECEATRTRFPDRRGVVVFNGIDTAFFHTDDARRRELRTRLGIQQDSFVAVYVGRIVAGKGIFDLLEAFAGLPASLSTKSQLVIVGPMETDLASFLSRKPALAHRVTLIGPVGKDDVRDYYQLSDVFVLPSYQEGISSSLVEAMACSLPAIVSNVGGNPEVVIDRDSGIVVKAGDVNGLRAALAELVGNVDLRLAMGRCARARIETAFAIEGMATGYLSEYERLLNK